jgi:hypothetical protein
MSIARTFSLLWIALIVATAAQPAAACIMAMEPVYHPSAAFAVYSRDDIVKKTEVIVEGVIEPSNPARPDDGLKFLRMHVDRVWKGAVSSDVVVILGLGLHLCPQAPPPLGERMRFSARLVEKRPFQAEDAITMTPELTQLIETHEDFLLYDAFSRTTPMVDLPLKDPELDRLLVNYQADTEAMRQRAETGDRAARLAYAGHLFDNNELHRALTAYEGILRDDPADLDLLLTLAIVRAQVHPGDEPEATLAEVERKAPQTTEWQGKIVRARFAATGRLAPGWKDWADLKRATHCEVSEGDFDDATFDRADLTDCEFVRSSFRNASFLHADLSDAYFEDSDLSGAKYDCATKLPDDLDPVAAGMINVEGKCYAP